MQYSPIYVITYDNLIYSLFTLQAFGTYFRAVPLFPSLSPPFHSLPPLLFLLLFYFLPFFFSSVPFYQLYICLAPSSTPYFTRSSPPPLYKYRLNLFRHSLAHNQPLYLLLFFIHSLSHKICKIAFKVLG